MDAERMTYRRIRLVIGVVAPLLLAFAVLIGTTLRYDAWVPGAQEAGICRALLAGTTVGRQALVGSCWVAPLPVLFYLPFAWLFSEPLAGRAAFLIAWFMVFWAIREAIKATNGSAWRTVLVQVALAGMALATPASARLQLPAVLMTAIMLLVGGALADWAAFRRLRDVVATGAAGAALVLCGFPAFVTAGAAVLLLPLAACGKRETRMRLSAWLLLGGLPLVYTLGVWLLMNRLILGDALFFVRSLTYLLPHLTSFFYALLASTAVLIPALLVTWICDQRCARKPGAGPVAGSAVLIAFGLELMVCGRVLIAHSVGWDAIVLQGCALAVFMVALGRLRQSLFRLAVSLIFVVLLGSRWGDLSSVKDVNQSHDEVPSAVEAFVRERTPYGRVFVMGYAGLDLLRSYTGDRLEPNMDLHIKSLREIYPGQVLYILVPRPQGRTRAESVFWKHPEFYTLGSERLLYAADFGVWRLFEIMAAPTREELDALRQHACAAHDHGAR